jgi:hypothetical protein
LPPIELDDDGGGGSVGGSLGPGESLASGSTTYLEPARPGAAADASLSALPSPPRHLPSGRTAAPPRAPRAHASDGDGEPRSPLSGHAGFHADVVFDSVAVEKRRKRLLLYLERWSVDDDSAHAIAFAQHGLAQGLAQGLAHHEAGGGWNNRARSSQVASSDVSPLPEEASSSATRRSAASASRGGGACLPPVGDPPRPRLTSWTRSA